MKIHFKIGCQMLVWWLCLLYIGSATSETPSAATTEETHVEEVVEEGAEVVNQEVESTPDSDGEEVTHIRQRRETPPLPPFVPLYEYNPPGSPYRALGDIPNPRFSRKPKNPYGRGWWGDLSGYARVALNSPGPEMDSRGFHGDIFDEGLKRFSPYKRAETQNLSERKKRETLDPGYVSYMNTIGYDPTMAWGRRKRMTYDPTWAYGKKKRYDYMNSIGYDPTMAWGKRDYMNSIGYDPTMAWGKRNYMNNIGYDPTMAWGKRNYLNYVGYDPSLYGKRNGFSDYYPPEMFSGSTNKRSDTAYNDAIIPFQQFHGFKKRNVDSVDHSSLKFKRSAESEETIEEQNDADQGDQTEEKRTSEMDAAGFHGDTFSDGFGQFSTVKKRKLGMGAQGFHGDTFTQGFGDFSTMKKRRPEMTSSGFYGDTFSNGFGDFYTMKRSMKRRPEMDSSGFYGDTFNGGFGDFYTMKRNLLKRRPEMDSSGFYGDTFNGGFGDFYTMKKNDPLEYRNKNNPSRNRKKREVDSMQRGIKRRPEMDSSGFYGDTFNGGFGDFYTMKRSHKRRPEMDSSGFYGDTFNGGFGDFYTMKRNLNLPGRPRRDADSMEDDGAFSELVNSNNREKRRADLALLSSLYPDNRPREALQKRHMGIDSRGFHGDVFSDGFGDFSTMRR